MLLAFRAENVRSFPGALELSLLATPLAEIGVPHPVVWREGGRPIEVLPTAGIFGANASGKSNLLRAMSDMRRLVLHSFRCGVAGQGMQRSTLRLDPARSAAPSSFEVDVILHGIRHEYGFVIDDAQVLEEWAYHYPHGKAALLFRREGGTVSHGQVCRAKWRTVREILRPNSLLLSAAAAANHPGLTPLYRWFANNLQLVEASTRARHWADFVGTLQNGQRHERALRLLRAADLRIADVGEFNADEESHGTMMWLGLANPVIDALAQGRALLVDDIEASLYPALVVQLVRMFQDAASNPQGAQLIFTSHQVSLLNDSGAERVLGRDQAWFTEKSHNGSCSVDLLQLSQPDRRVLSGLAF